MRRPVVLLALMGLLSVAAAASDGGDASAGLNRLTAAASRSGLTETDLAPVLAGLDQLQQEGLPTGRYVARMVECVAKGAPGESLRTRARLMVEGTRAARLLVAGLEAQGLKEDGRPGGWSPVEELADTLETGPVTPADLSALVRELKADRLDRVLAGAESLAHLQAIGISNRQAHELLSAMPAALPDGELVRLPWVVLVGRRCGMADADVLQALYRSAGTGTHPTALAREWARAAGLRGPGMGRGPGWGSQDPGGRGRGQGFGSPGSGGPGGSPGGPGGGGPGGGGPGGGGPGGGGPGGGGRG
jgi:hypothetical protein